jgi:hypothetical protein
MTIATCAKYFFRTLPSDCEEPNRALHFQELIFQSVYSNDAERLVREIYHQAATGDWQEISIYDLSMLVYSLALNPALIPVVRTDVETILRRNGANELARCGWPWVRRLQPGVQHRPTSALDVSLVAPTKARPGEQNGFSMADDGTLSARSRSEVA